MILRMSTVTWSTWSGDLTAASSTISSPHGMLTFNADKPDFEAPDGREQEQRTYEVTVRGR